MSNDLVARLRSGDPLFTCDRLDAANTIKRQSGQIAFLTTEAESLRAQRDRALEVLRELVVCMDLKEDAALFGPGKDRAKARFDYASRGPLAWQAARTLLNEVKP